MKKLRISYDNLENLVAVIWLVMIVVQELVCICQGYGEFILDPLFMV